MYYILENKRPKPINDALEWSRFMANQENRIIKQTTLENGIFVSTVFLGIDHGFHGRKSLLFETMIFGGEHDQFQERYETWEEAEIGHQRAIDMVFNI